MLKQNTVTQQTPGGSYNSNISKYILKKPSMFFYFIVITVILFNIKAFFLQRYLRSMVPMSHDVLHLIIDIIFGIFLIVVAVYFLKKYILVYENKVKTEERFESVVNSIKEVVFQTDASGIWTFLNPAWTEVTGFDVESCIGKSFLDFVYPEDRDKNVELFEPLVERKKEFCRHEIRYLSKNNGYCWVEVYARLIIDENGNVVGTSGTLMDITKRKEMEQVVIERERILQGVADATGILLRNVKIGKAFSRVLEVLGKATGAERVYIFQNHINKINQKVIVSQKYEWCNTGIEPQINNPDLQDVCYEGFGIMRWYNTLSNGKEISGSVRDFPSSERDILEPQGIKSLVVVPIFVENFFWGFLGFDSCSKDRGWTNPEIALLSTAAASIGGAIKRAEDENKIQSLLKSDLKQTVQNLQNLVFKCKMTSEKEILFTLFEGKLAERIGLSTDKVFERDIFEILFDTTDSIKDNFAKAFQGKVCSFEMKYCERIYYTSLSPIVYEDKIVEIVGSSIDITDLKAAQEKIHYMAYYDSLTGLHNRAFFKKQLSYLISHANRNNKIMAIMYLDLDRFKLVNDTLGHIAGDELLKNTATRLKRVVKENDILVRMGGDEFVIVFPEVNVEGEISKLSQKIIDVFQDTFNINGHEIYISTSIGISLYPFDGTDIDTLIKNADTAMYRSKENGRNNYQFYTDDMHRRALKRLETENNLRRALEKDELYIVYQPRFNIKTGKVVGAEALLRWKHSTLGLISPSEFIPVAEETGIIHDIGKWVLYTVCKEINDWDIKGNDFRVSINISAMQFQREDFIEIVKEILRDTGLNPNNLEIEITENTIMHKTEKTLRNIKELKELGIQISIDDFGTGFSSLSYISEFDSDNLKIDKSFIWDIGVSPSNESIISAIISIAHSMEMNVIAEGVETEEQLEFLIKKDCDEVQGFLYSKPLSPSEFISFVDKDIWSI